MSRRHEVIEELRASISSIGDSTDRQQHIVALVGEPGSGKTTIAESLAAPDATRWSIVGRVSETYLSWSGLQQLSRPAAADLARLPDALQRAWTRAVDGVDAMHGDRRTLGVAVLRLFELASERQPLLVIVDDIQWLDAESREAIAFACARLDREQLRVAFVGRELPIDIDRLVARQWTLPEFDVAESIQLLHALADDFDASVATRLAIACNGNPLALTEITGLLDEPTRRGRRLLPDPLPVGPHIANIFVPRLANVAAQHRQAMVLAVLLAGQQRRELIAATRELGLPSTSLNAVAETGLVRVDDIITLRHPLVRDTVLQWATADERYLADTTLSETMSDPLAAALHLADAPLGADHRAWLNATEVVKRLRAAALLAWDRSSLSQAAQLLERAAELADSVERLEILNDVWQYRLASGERERARETLDRMNLLAEDASQRVAIEAYRADVDLEIKLATPADITADVDTWAASNPDATARYLSTISMQAAMAGRVSSARSMIERAGQLAIDPEVGVRVRMVREMIDTIQGDLDDIQLLKLPWHELVNEDMLVRGAIPVSLLVAVQSRLDEFDLAMALSEHADRTLNRYGLVGLQINGNRAMAYCLVRLGRLHDALSLLHRTNELAALIGEGSTRAQGIAMECWIGAVQGHDPATLFRQLESLGSGEMFPVITALEGVALFAHATGDTAAACNAYERSHDLLATAGVDDPFYTSGDCDLAVLLHHRGDTARARLLLDSMWTNLARSPRTSIAAVAARCEAIVADDPADAQRWFTTAFDHHRATPLPFDEARTRLAHGQWLRRSRQRNEARTELHNALDIFGMLGAPAWADAVNAELRALGERRADSPDRRRQLTNQEMQVATAVARGGTNADVAAALYLSRRTVEYHLHNVYRKLGIDSRAELARAFQTAR